MLGILRVCQVKQTSLGHSSFAPLVSHDVVVTQTLGFLKVMGYQGLLEPLLLPALTCL